MDGQMTSVARGAQESKRPTGGFVAVRKEALIGGSRCRTATPSSHRAAHGGRRQRFSATATASGAVAGARGVVRAVSAARAVDTRPSAGALWGGGVVVGNLLRTGAAAEAEEKPAGILKSNGRPVPTATRPPRAVGHLTRAGEGAFKGAEPAAAAATAAAYSEGGGKPPQRLGHARNGGQQRYPRRGGDGDYRSKARDAGRAAAAAAATTTNSPTTAATTTSNTTVVSIASTSPSTSPVSAAAGGGSHAEDEGPSPRV